MFTIIKINYLFNHKRNFINSSFILNNLKIKNDDPSQFQRINNISNLIDSIKPIKNELKDDCRDVLKQIQEINEKFKREIEEVKMDQKKGSRRNG